jgi:hypothetical protein
MQASKEDGRKDGTKERAKDEALDLLFISFWQTRGGAAVVAPPTKIGNRYIDIRCSQG